MAKVSSVHHVLTLFNPFYIGVLLNQHKSTKLHCKTVNKPLHNIGYCIFKLKFKPEFKMKAAYSKCL